MTEDANHQNSLSLIPALKQTSLFRSLKEEGKSLEMRDLLEEVSRTILTPAPLESPNIPDSVDIEKESESEAGKMEQCSVSQSLGHKKFAEEAQNILEQKQQAVKCKEAKMKEFSIPLSFDTQESCRERTKEQFEIEYQKMKRDIQTIKDAMKGERHV